jgi:hypothetical protein
MTAWSVERSWSEVRAASSTATVMVGTNSASSARWRSMASSVATGSNTVWGMIAPAANSEASMPST